MLKSVMVKFFILLIGIAFGYYWAFSALGGSIVR